MANYHHRRTTCRQCDSSRLSLGLKIQQTPLANAFVPRELLDQEQPSFPLDVFLCEDCKHLQLLDVIDPHVLYEHYVYVSGTSPVFVEHFRKYAEDIASTYTKGSGFVVDIGSNDGTLLSFFKQRGFQILGVEPAQEIANDANARGLTTLVDFFDPAVAAKIVSEHGPASVVTANNVFAHLDDPRTFLEGIRTLLAGGDGVFVFEVSYIRDVIEKNLFDTIYHEHLDYHAIGPLVGFFKRNGFELINAVRVDTHGGSIRVVVQWSGGKHDVAPSVTQLINEEIRIGLDRLQTYTDFSARIDAIGGSLRSVLSEIKSQGKTIAGYGAPAKATTLMYHFGIGSDIVDYIVDDSPWKQSLYSPGQHIPIVSSATLEERRPDYLLVLAWNFSASIIQKNAAFRAQGGKFIVPLPTVQIV